MPFWILIRAQADDVVIVERYKNAVKYAFNRLEMEAQKMGSVINYDKVKLYGKW